MPITQINRRIAELLKLSNKEARKVLADSEKQIILNYKTVLNDIRAEVSALYEKYGDTMSYADANRYNRLTGLEAEIAQAIKVVTGENIKVTRQAIKTVFEKSYYRSAYAYESGIGAKLGFTELNKTAIDASVLNPLDKITWIDRSKAWGTKLTQDVNQTITSGLIKGDGYSKTAHALSDKVDISLGRAQRIVRTESNRALSLANKTSYDKAKSAADRLGIEMVEVWTTIMDGKERHDHAKMNGQEADADGYFTLPNGAKTKGPRLSGLPEEDIECRCTTRSVIKTFPNKAKGSAATPEFDEWLNLKFK
jgi:hypothetical protein